MRCPALRAKSRTWRLLEASPGKSSEEHNRGLSSREDTLDVTVHQYLELLTTFPTSLVVNAKQGSSKTAGLILLWIALVRAGAICSDSVRYGALHEFHIHQSEHFLLKQRQQISSFTGEAAKTLQKLFASGDFMERNI